MLEPLEIMDLMQDMRSKPSLIWWAHEKRAYFAGADFPHTVANVMIKKRESIFLHIIKKVSGVPIGFIGVVTTETTKFVLPDE